MHNLFQKIISRSEGFATESKRPVPSILPDKPLFFNEKQTDFIKEDDPKSEFVIGPYENTLGKSASLKNVQSEASNTNYPVPPKQGINNRLAQDMNQKNNPQLPFSNTQNDFKKNELPQRNPPDHSGNANAILPAATIIKKINQRNFLNPLIGKEGKEIRLKSEMHSDGSFSNINSPGRRKVQEEKTERKEEKKKEQDFFTAKKQLQPKQPIKEVGEHLLPVQEEHFPINTEKKTGQNNKLVIGRITVEIINPVPAPTKTNEPPMRQSNIRKASNTTFTSINKLSFGLGQL